MITKDLTTKSMLNVWKREKIKKEIEKKEALEAKKKAKEEAKMTKELEKLDNELEKEKIILPKKKPVDWESPK